MNRENKFRGFQPELKKWVFGSLVTMPQGGAWILDYKTGFEDRIRVNANTVGYFTGLTDKNDKEIYEGDILHLHYAGQILKEHVVFDCGAFKRQYTEDDGSIHKLPFTELSERYIEVIGNMHDNPELLK